MEPTIGRIVHYYYDPIGHEDFLPGGPGPLAAIVTYVHTPTIINLCVFDGNGETRARTSVDFSPDGEQLAGVGAWAAWPILS
jgi:hypothetical protein